MQQHRMKTVPFKHQQEAYELSKDSEYFAYFCEMGTGKSKIIIDNICHLYTTGKIVCALIVAPKGVIPAWFSNSDSGASGQLVEHMWDIPHNIVTWSPDKTKKNQAALDSVILPPASFDTGQPPFHRRPLRILLMNVEAISTRRGVLTAKDFLVQGPSFMAVDESTTIKSISTNRSKGACWLGRMATYRRIGTGMPVEQSPLELYGQCEFLKPGLLGHRSFYSFRGVYASLVNLELPTGKFITDPSGERHQVKRRTQKVVGYKNLERLSKLLKGFSYRVKKEDCLDLPDKIYQTRVVELTDDQRRVYKTMRDKAVAELTLGDNATWSGQCTAPIVITQLLRLHQIVCGHLPLDGGGVVELPHNRMTALLEVLEEAQGKVIVWATYRRDVQAIESKLREVYGDCVVSYFGDTTQDDRADATKRFQTDPECRFFVGTPSTAGMGLTLTAASTVVYYSNSHSVKHRVQSEDRAHRIGQTKAVTYIDLVCPQTVDALILKSLREKRELAELVVDDGWKALI